MSPVTLCTLALAAEPRPDIERGAELAAIAGCANCHALETGGPLSGGPPLATRFGTFFSPNITPDPTHGIGGWTEDDLERALRKGRSPDGRPYYPSFPYTSYGALDPRDVRDLYAWLMDQEPVSTPSVAHDLRVLYRGRWKLRLWKLVAFRRPAVLDGTTTVSVQRGAYLGTALAHCAECHTPRGPLGRLRHNRGLCGNTDPPEPAPNITAHETGIGHWTHDDLVSYLSDGMSPDGDFAGAGMADVIHQGTARLDPADRAALASWLFARPPAPSCRPVPDTRESEEESEEEEWF